MAAKMDSMGLSLNKGLLKLEKCGCYNLVVLSYYGKGGPSVIRIPTIRV